MKLARDAAWQAFLEAYPAYRETEHIDRLRAEEYPALAREGLAYLDYTGGGLYSLEQVRAHQRWLAEAVYGNPHSVNRPSQRATEAIEETRQAVLRFFHADPAEYVVVFTANATAALRLVGEAYPFAAGSILLLSADNHNSVIGIREFARRAGATVAYAPVAAGDLRAQTAVWEKALAAEGSGPRLFAYPAQSNFSGVQHGLAWVDRAQRAGWQVILDVAAFVPTNRLDLSVVHPDFVPVSFYKMFGYPTGVGCLVARRAAMERLSRPWFSGGTVVASSVAAGAHAMRPAPEGFEDGTPDYLSIPALRYGLDQLDRLSLEAVHVRVHALTAWTIDQLVALRHRSGRPVVRIFGPADERDRGGTIALAILDEQGRMVDERLVAKAANQAGIVLRTGCFCNPGAGEVAMGMDADALGQALAGLGRWQTVDDLLGLTGAGAVRVSFGAVSDFNDAWRLVEFVAGFRDRTLQAVGLPPRTAC
jgi:molybdenum cofactor sulfurtransferase